MESKMPKTHTLIVQNRYFELLENGKKTVEARVNKCPYNKIEKGDLIQFQINEDLSKVVLCKVKDKFIYPTFKELLEKEGLKPCLPDALSVDEGVQTYHSFGKYETEVEKYQAVAFRIINLGTRS